METSISRVWWLWKPNGSWVETIFIHFPHFLGGISHTPVFVACPPGSKPGWVLGNSISDSMRIPNTRTHHWLVVGPPLWKIWLRQLGWLATQQKWENKNGNQTTNQSSSTNHHFSIFSCNVLGGEIRKKEYVLVSSSSVHPLSAQHFFNPLGIHQPRRWCWSDPGVNVLNNIQLLGIFHLQQILVGSSWAPKRDRKIPTPLICQPLINKPPNGCLKN